MFIRIITFVQFINAIKENKSEIAFNGQEKDDKKTNNVALAILGGATILGITALSYFSLKNIRKSEEFIKKGLENTKEGLETIIKEFNENKPLGRVEGTNGQLLTGKDAYKHIIETMLDSIYANPAEIE